MVTWGEAAPLWEGVAPGSEGTDGVGTASGCESKAFLPTHGSSSSTAG